VWLATKPSEIYFRIQKISEALDLPYHFLAKSLQSLVHANILESHRGANGGVKLASLPTDITIISIIEAIDGSVLFDRCLLGIGDCEAEKPCAMHAQWEVWRQEMHDMYSATMLSDMVKDFTLHKIKRL
jgi:Rrf2 family protein